MTPVSDRRDRLLAPAHLAALGVAAVGLVAATVSTQLALDAGEVPVTILPVGGLLAASGIVAIAAVRVLGVGLLWLAVDRWAPDYLPHAMAGAGLFWLVIALWQAWLMLART